MLNGASIVFEARRATGHILRDRVTAALAPRHPKSPSMWPTKRKSRWRRKKDSPKSV